MHIVIVGAGGNIGSHVVPLLARMLQVTALTLIDRDTYEPANLGSQNIVRRDVGRPKALVQARRALAARAEIAVTPMVADLETLPLGQLRADLIVACLDSRRARLSVNQAAWRLGVPWVDAGIESASGLARVTTYLPGEGLPCLECAWDDDDYAAYEQEYPCGAAEAPATGATAALGSLAAALQAIECEAVLDGISQEGSAGRQIVVDPRNRKQLLTMFRRRPGCRMPDHDGWRIQPLGPGSLRLPVRTLLDPSTCGTSARLAVAGCDFIENMACHRCGWRAAMAAVRAARPRCPKCQAPVRVAGFDRRDVLAVSDIPRRVFNSSWRRLGLHAGDVVSIESGGSLNRYEVRP